MPASHQKHSQNHGANGSNGDNGRNGGDHFPQSKPSTSSEEAEERLASLQSLCFRGLDLSRVLVRWLVRRFSEALGGQTPSAVRYALDDAQHAISSVSVAASQPQRRNWYILVPIRLLKAITSAGANLMEMYLDIRVPENRYYANSLRGLCVLFTAYEEVASHQPDFDVHPKAERPATAAEAAGGVAVSTKQPQPHSHPEPQPQPQPEPQPQPLATGDAKCLASAEEAEQAAVGAPCTPSAKPVSSRDFQAAGRPSRPTPGPIRTARSPAKAVRFFNLFGSKKD